MCCLMVDSFVVAFGNDSLHNLTRPPYQSIAPRFFVVYLTSHSLLCFILLSRHGSHALCSFRYPRWRGRTYWFRFFPGVDDGWTPIPFYNRKTRFSFVQFSFLFRLLMMFLSRSLAVIIRRVAITFVLFLFPLKIFPALTATPVFATARRRIMATLSSSPWSWRLFLFITFHL